MSAALAFLAWGLALVNLALVVVALHAHPTTTIPGRVGVDQSPARPGTTERTARP